jgi:O-antigen ligase
VRRRSRRWQRGVSIDWVLPALALTVCMVAMFMTRSRAGSLASVIGLIIVLVAFFRRALASRTALLVAGAGTIAGSALLIQILGGGVAERISVDGVSDAGRWHTYHSTLELIRSAPWLGTGLGTYPWVFPPFRSPDITTWGVWDRAHNTYLELMAETGIPLAALLAIGWIAMLAVLVRGVLTRRRGIGRPAAALGVLVAATLHTMVDFPLQIPAYSIIVFALTGVGLAQSWRAPDPSAQTKDTQLSLA